MRRILFVALFITMFTPPKGDAQNSVSISDSAKSGAALYAELRCGSCHETAASGINIPPALANAGDKFQTSWLEAYLQAPSRRRWASAGVRPILRMPNFLLSDPEARALAEFLSTRRDTTRTMQSSLALSDSAQIAEGKQIFQEYACYGCHQIGGAGGKVGPDLDAVGRRLRPQYLSAFLKNPQAFIQDSPMKISELWEEEVHALVAYLMSLK